MTKKLATLGIILIVLVGGFGTPINVLATHPCSSIIGNATSPHLCNPSTPSPGQNGPLSGFSLNPIDIAKSIIDFGSKAIAQLMITTASFALIISGLLFDFVIKFTILEVSKNLAANGGIGQSIAGTWETLRDIANMFFIFVLIWTAFKAMFELSFAGLGGAIKNIIIIALLINFSLFFSKVVIDASNIAALGFYKSIVNQEAPLTTNSFGPNVAATVKGISGGYMNMLGIQNFLNADILDAIKTSPNFLLIGFVISAFMLIISVIFIITSIMFIARFIILIFLMILSPLAFVAYMVPAMKGQFDKWKEALISQSFFAPLFFALTWVVFKIGNGLKVLIEVNNNTRQSDWTDLFVRPDQMMILVMNYCLMVGFAIAALVFAKSMASKAPGFSQISGGVMSGSAALGRNTVGRIAHERAQANREEWSKTAGGRAKLWLADKASSSSFDIRGVGNIGAVKALGGDKALDGLGSASGKGGFNAAVEAKAKEKAAYAKRVYGQTPADIERDKKEKERLQEEINKGKDEEEKVIKTKRKTEAENADTRYNVNKMAAENHIKNKLKPDFDDLADLKNKRKEKEKELNKARTDKEKPEVIEKLEKESASLTKSIEIKNEDINEGRKNIEETDTEYIDLKKKVEERKKEFDEAKKLVNSGIKENEYTGELQKKIKEHKELNSGNRRQKEYAKRVGSGIFGWTAGNRAAQIAIEKQATDKTSKDKVTDAVKALFKEDEETEKKDKTEEPKEEKKEGGEEKKS